MKRTRRLACAITVAVASLAPPLHAAPNRLADGVRQSESEQAQIKNQIQRATDDLTAIITELDRNGIAGEDVKTLVKIRDVLGDLTAKDMATVINLLQQARNSADPSKFRGDVTQAVVNQDQIIVKMKQLLLEYQRQQQLYELSLRFTELAQRQNANLKDARNLVRSPGALLAADRYSDLQKSSLKIQAGEQDAIRDETKLLTDKLAQVITEADADTADRLRKSLEHARQGRLHETLAEASTHLKDAMVGKATQAEKLSRDNLYDLASLVAPIEDSAAKLRKAAEQLDKAIAEQKVVVTQTGTLPAKVSGAPSTYQEAFFQIEDREADNVDLVDRLRQAIDVIAPAVTEPLKAGQGKMQEARAALNSFRRDPATTLEQIALAKLEEARKLLDQQVTKADAEKPKGDAMQQAKELKDKVAQLRAEQEKLNQQTQTAQPKDAAKLAKQEAAMHQTARDLQIESAPEAPPAANEIAAAAKEMDRSREALEKGQTNDAQPPERSAVDHLARAEKLLDQQLAKLDQDKQDLDQLQQARDKVAKLIQDEQRVALNTATEAGKQEARQSPDPAADKQVGQQQSDVGKKTDETRQSLPASAKDATQPLDSAKQNMNEAKSNLDQAQPQAAQPPEQQAIANLNQAKSAIDQKVSELQKELGRPSDPADKLDQVSQQLQQAQQDINGAQQQMQQTPSQQLAQQQQQVAQQIQQQQQQDPNNPQLQQAQKAANQAATDLQQNNVQKAVAQMKQVQTAIQKASQQTSQQGQKQPGQPQQGQPKPGEQANGQQQSGQKASQPGNQPGQQPSQNGQPSAQAQGQAQQPGNAQQPGQQQGQQPGQQPGQGQQSPGNGGTPGQSMSQIAQAQSAVQQAAEQLAAAQQQQQMQQAAQQLGQAANKVTDAAANDQGALPQTAQQALQQAQKALNEATAQAQASNQQGAQAQSQSAQSAISQAQAAIDMARQGMQQNQTADSQQNPSNSPSQSQSPGPQAKNSQGSPGSNSPNQDQPNQNQPGQQGTGDRKDTRLTVQANGPRGNVSGNSTYLSLPARDRQAIQQGQKDKYPEEYGPAIEQYLKNLSDQESR